MRWFSPNTTPTPGSARIIAALLVTWALGSIGLWLLADSIPPAPKPKPIRTAEEPEPTTAEQLQELGATLRQAFDIAYQNAKEIGS